MKYISIPAAMLAAALVSACGGGGSGGDEPNATVASTQAFQFKNAWANYQSQGFTKSFTLTGTASNATAGSYALSGNGNVTQYATPGQSFTPEGETLPVSATKVERNYVINAVANGLSIPQRMQEVAYYDSSDYHYLGGTYTDNTGATINNLLVSWTAVPETLTCCQTASSSLYKTNASSGGALTHNIQIQTTADKADSIFVNLNDLGTAGQRKSYRLTASGLAPTTEALKAVAAVLTTRGTFMFNIDAQFNY